MSSSPLAPALAPTRPLHHPRRHAASRTDHYVFNQLIPYIGNKRKLLHLIAQAVARTGCRGGWFIDLFTGSTVVARWAKQAGFAVLANDWEPYAHCLAQATVQLNRPPAFKHLGGPQAVFDHLNRLPPCRGYIATHLCPADDENPDPCRERMFFTQANGRRIDAIREQLHQWHQAGLIDQDELAYVLAPLLYAVCYASNTSGLFKAYHHGWGGRTATALYRILAPLTLHRPVLFDNGRTNLASRHDAQELAGRLTEYCGTVPDIVYLDPPYNQHPYGSNYHVLNTVTLWDKPPLNQDVLIDGKPRNKAAIRTDWRHQRRSAYNHRRHAPAALADLLARIEARWILLSYSTDGNIALPDLLTMLAERGRLSLIAQPYKRYRVSRPRMSARSHNLEFVAAVNCRARPNRHDVPDLLEHLEQARAQLTAMAGPEPAARQARP